MPITQFRIFFDNKPTDIERLDMIEEIVVDQEVDLAWEARLKIPICADEKGRWKDEDMAFAQSFSRVRVEVQIGDPPFVPLIDGPVVADERPKEALPGQSSITLIVHDDSVYLNRHEEVRYFDDRTDAQIAEDLFKGVKEIASTVIDSTPHPSGYLPLAFVQRGTPMNALRSLARNQGMHVYVLPGGNPGESVAHFNHFPSGPSDLPSLVLLGSNQNIKSFRIHNDAQRTASVQTYRLDIPKKGEVKGTTGLADLELLGSQALFESDADIGTVITLPGVCTRVDPKRRAGIEAERASYSVEATGEVIEGCYPAVLRPYSTVTVMGVDGRYSGEYRIKKVTHTINRSNYTQSFTLTTNAISAGAGSSTNGDIARSIF
jgi:hypothetical protein